MVISLSLNKCIQYAQSCPLLKGYKKLQIVKNALYNSNSCKWQNGGKLCRELWIWRQWENNHGLVTFGLLDITMLSLGVI